MNRDTPVGSETWEDSRREREGDDVLAGGDLSRGERKVERVWIGVALLIGLFGSFIWPWVIAPDGISYLDVGDFWLKGEALKAVNGYWNPIYPILLGIASRVVGNPIYEPMAAHVVNFGVYTLNLFLFSRLLRVMRRIRFAGEDADSGWQTSGLFSAVAYVLFIWCHAGLIDLASLAPDILVNSAVVAATICLVRLIESENSVLSAVGLGLALALGYLVKAVMFVAAPFFMLAAVLCATRLAKGVRNAAVALIVFLVVSAPYIVLLSRQRGHLTYSESGKLAYGWMVNRAREYFHWRGAEPGTGVAAHPTRQLLAEPEVFEFGDRPGTYPPWFDPSYWHEGLKVRLDLKQQFRAILRDQRIYYEVFFQQATSIVLLMILAAGFTGIVWRSGSRWRRTWPLLIPAVAGFCIYLPVFVMTRHLSAFVLVFYLVALWNVWPTARRVLPARVVKMMLACAMIPIVYALIDYGLNIHVLKRIDGDMHKRVTLALKDFGVKPGDRIAILGRGCEADFARMGRLKIVAEAYRGVDATPGWARTAEAEARTIEALKPLGVRAIIRDLPANFESPLPWKPIANSKYSILAPDR